MKQRKIDWGKVLAYSYFIVWALAILSLLLLPKELRIYEGGFYWG